MGQSEAVIQSRTDNTMNQNRSQWVTQCCTEN